MAYGEMRSRLRSIGPKARTYNPLPQPRQGEGGYGSVSPAGAFVKAPPADILPRTYRGPMQAPGGMPAPPVQPFTDVSRYVTFQSFPFTVPANSDLVILNRPTTTRVYLFIVNTTAPAAVPPSFIDRAIFIAFDRPATNDDIPLVTAGGAFEWLYTIPQNVIHAFNDEATDLTGVLSFAELDPCAVNCDTIGKFNRGAIGNSIPDFAPIADPHPVVDAISSLVPEPIAAAIQTAAATAAAAPAAPQMYVVNDAHQLIPVSKGGQPAQFWRDRGYQVWGAPTTGRANIVPAPEHPTQAANWEGWRRS